MLGQNRTMRARNATDKKKYQPEPALPVPVQYQTHKAEYYKRIKPYYVQVPLHLLMIGKEIKEYHHYSQNRKEGKKKDIQYLLNVPFPEGVLSGL